MPMEPPDLKRLSIRSEKKQTKKIETRILIGMF